ncbi:MAG: DUF4173 domain-containing protein [Actinomycetaceae bacterium]|nr:DUF4173 domain-containing protein [Actinomycetaceae bacterium]
MTTPASATPETGNLTPEAPQNPQNAPTNPVPAHNTMPPQGMPPQGTAPQGTPHYAYILPPQQAPQPREPIPFSRADWLIFALAGIEALIFIIAFNIGGNDAMYGLPGIGLTLMIYAHLGFVVLALRGKARYDRTTIFLIAATLLLGAFPTIYGNHTLRFLNLLIVWVLMIFTTFLMSNIWESAKMRLTPFICAFTTWFLSIFVHIARPLDAVRAFVRTREKGNSKKILPVALGILLAGTVLAIVLPLLFSADAIFAKGFSDTLGSLFSFDAPTLILRSVTLIVMWPAFFGVLWGLARTSKPNQTVTSTASSFARALRLPATTALIVLGTLVLVYAAFIWVQAVYLFGGRTEAIAAGSYSEYARSGFFQLVAVAAINLAVALLAAYSAHNRRTTDGGLSPSPTPVVLVRVGVILLLIQTAVILVSAFKRMNLYVDAYGLSLLRILTYLGMAFIAVCLIIVCLYTFRAQTPVFAATFVAGVVLWAAFNLINPEMRIATYNVEHYLSGDMKEFDVNYFWDFSPAVAPTIEEYRRHEVSHIADEVLEHYRDEVKESPWQAWSLAFLNNDKD